jgi:peptide/nickel transport system ATP-binding protein
MIFQDPMTSLNPYMSIASQMTSVVRAHEKVSQRAARARCIEMLKAVQIPDPRARLDRFPHELSGGMRQRVMIATSLLMNPELLIADEPTTALDVTVQAQILELMRDLQNEFNTPIIIITHDLGVVAEFSDRVGVMYGRRLVERGTIEDIFYRPQMPYTIGLLASVPRMDQLEGGRLDPIPGQPPSLLAMPSGCVFRPRCTYSQFVPDNRCATDLPELLPAESDGHDVRCHLTPEQRTAFAAERLGVAAGETA